jgi:hypothetical protein
MEVEAYCPYCGERVSLWVDEDGGLAQEYVEDCSVCCRPWRVHAALDGSGGADVSLAREDD